MIWVVCICMYANCFLVGYRSFCIKLLIYFMRVLLSASLFMRILESLTFLWTRNEREWKNIYKWICVCVCMNMWCEIDARIHIHTREYCIYTRTGPYKLHINILYFGLVFFLLNKSFFRLILIGQSNVE